MRLNLKLITLPCNRVMTECVDNLTALSKIKLDIASFSTDSAEYKAKSKEIEGLFDKSKPLFESLRVSPYLPKLASGVFLNLLAFEGRFTVPICRSLQHSGLYRRESCQGSQGEALPFHY